ncbi:MAG TPA: hypothetical protein VFM72_07895 [Aequorivita sp.]|nr:hypothetical protein [Aequorivita sp.]
MFWRIIKKLDFKQLIGLFWLFLQNPLYAFPTIFATKSCMNIAQMEYGSRHHLSNQANAFRHAFWVILIVKKCLKWRANEEKAKAWAITFTNWHEDFSPNAALERAMDLHNNEMGIVIFEEIKNKNEAEIVSFLKRKATEAVKIGTVGEVGNFKTELIYIE